MNFLLDTNIVSEWTKPRPDPGVVNWLAEADEDRIYLSVITIAELCHGIERLPAGARRLKLHDWLMDQVPQRFGDRLLMAFFGGFEFIMVIIVIKGMTAARQQNKWAAKTSTKVR